MFQKNKLIEDLVDQSEILVQNGGLKSSLKELKMLIQDLILVKRKVNALEATSKSTGASSSKKRPASNYKRHFDASSTRRSRPNPEKP